MITTRVLFDTSALLDIRLNSAQAERLRTLCREGLCEVYVPEIVVDELKSQLSERLRPPGELLGALSWLAGDQYREVVNAVEQLKTLNKAEVAGGSVNAWLEGLGAVIVPYEAADAVFRSYFEGSGTFRKPKARDDIPDGFVFAAMRSLASKDPVHAVCKDGLLAKAMKGLPHVSAVHAGLLEFLAIDDFTPSFPLLDSTAVIDSNGERILQLVADDIVSAVIGRDVFMDKDHAFFMGRISALRNLDLGTVDAADTFRINDHVVSVFFACAADADLVRDPAVSSLIATELTVRLDLEVEAEVRLRARSGKTLEVTGANLARVEFSMRERLWAGQ